MGRGTRRPEKQQPVGSVFAIEDESAPFLTVESATQVRGIQFWYPRQPISDGSLIIEYPPTLQVSKTKGAQGVTLSCLTFFGEFMAMDFAASRHHICEQILFEHCYGYRVSFPFLGFFRGRIVSLDGEIARCGRLPPCSWILRCHRIRLVLQPP